jgi:SPOR domain
LAQPPLHPEQIRLLDMLPASATVPATAGTSGLSLSLSTASAPAASAPQPVPVHSSVLPEPSPAKPASHTAADRPEKSSCAEWGEFSGNDLVRAQQALSALKLGDSLTHRRVEHNHGYWVYIPPMKKRASVEKKIAQLKARGVKDYFVMQEKGKWQNAISLGVFRTRDAAEKYIVQLRSKDVRSAKLGERLSKLKYTVFDIKDIDSGIADKLNALQKEFPESRLKVSACGN